mmetsp:Transcript_19229/g.55936  ORF Transcript_19229/g.55936 Transcript_19229/m.55936 type:complete len:313 (-) Transcript_19229:936-1874(-)
MYWDTSAGRRVPRQRRNSLRNPVNPRPRVPSPRRSRTTPKALCGAGCLSTTLPLTMRQASNPTGVSPAAAPAAPGAVPGARDTATWDHESRGKGCSEPRSSRSSPTASTTPPRVPSPSENREPRGASAEKTSSGAPVGAPGWWAGRIQTSKVSPSGVRSRPGVRTQASAAPGKRAAERSWSVGSRTPSSSMCWRVMSCPPKLLRMARRQYRDDARKPVKICESRVFWAVKQPPAGRTEVQGPWAWSLVWSSNVLMAVPAQPLEGWWSLTPDTSARVCTSRRIHSASSPGWGAAVRAPECQGSPSRVARFFTS